MRLFMLQIRDGKSGMFDEVYLFENITDLIAEYQNKFNYYLHRKNLKLISHNSAKLDENDEISGDFLFADGNSGYINARCTDYDL